MAVRSCECGKGCKECTECFCQELCRQCPNGCTTGISECPVFEKFKKYDYYCNVDCSTCSVTWALALSGVNGMKEDPDATDACEGQWMVTSFVTRSSLSLSHSRNPGKNHIGSVIASSDDPSISSI